MTEHDLAARLTKLEELQTHDQQLLRQLNEVVIDLRAQLDEVQNRCAELARRLEAVGQTPSVIEDRPERPPHY